jgi:hypothetical protein
MIALKRPRQSMPDDVAEALRASGVYVGMAHAPLRRDHSS